MVGFSWAYLNWKWRYNKLKIEPRLLRKILIRRSAWSTIGSILLFVIPTSYQSQSRTNLYITDTLIVFGESAAFVLGLTVFRFVIIPPLITELLTSKLKENNEKQTLYKQINEYTQHPSFLDSYFSHKMKAQK